MRVAALAMIAIGVLATASASISLPFDFAIAVRPGWHVTVFPPPLFVGVLSMLLGLVALVASLWR